MQAERRLACVSVFTSFRSLCSGSLANLPILKRMRHVILSVDYEIFGNGTGDVRQHMTVPTEDMARLCEKHQAPLTVFVEMEETLAFERYARELTERIGYNPYREIRNQVVDLARRGHDIQLHLHPQWHNTRLVNGEWELDDSKPTVDSLFSDQHATTAYIRERKQALEEMTGASNRSHRVVAYRAGAFSAQPGSKLIGALAENDFVLDSSVVHGLQRKDEHVHLDYRNAPAGKSLWRVEADVAVEAPQGRLWELPIASTPGRRLNQLTFGRLKAKFSKNVPKAQQSRLMKQLGVRKSPLQFARFLCQRVPLKLDFHNVAPAKLVRWIRNAPRPLAGLPDVVVLIGHSKEHINNEAFATLVRLIHEDGSMKVSGFKDIAPLLPALSPPSKATHDGSVRAKAPSLAGYPVTRPA
jgi:hypothetical protein